jgi:nucleotide-binding universal stress UspA family protein
VLNVFEYADAVPPEAGGQLVDLETICEEARIKLNGLLKTAQQAGLDCSTEMASGVPSMTILDTIAAKQVDLAILGTNALHGFERLVFGSVAEDVLRQSPCPVLTVGPRTQDPAALVNPGGPTLFATDFDARTIQAIRYAESFCEVIGAPLHCLHVLPRSIEANAVSCAVPQIMTEALHQVALDTGVSIEPPVCAIAYGSEVSNAVVDYAKREQAKLIVLGVRQASMMASHLSAHIAYRIITEAPCPVLTMAFGLRKTTGSLAACF